MCMPRNKRLARYSTPEILQKIEVVKANIADNKKSCDDARRAFDDDEADHYCEQSHIREGWLTSYLQELGRRAEYYGPPMPSLVVGSSEGKL